MTDKKKLTTAGGAPVPDNQNAMTAGRRGPMLLQDIWFLEKLAHFDREVIPERRYYSQPGKLFRLMTAGQKQVLFENTARAMGDAPKEIEASEADAAEPADTEPAAAGPATPEAAPAEPAEPAADAAPSEPAASEPAA